MMFAALAALAGSTIIDTILTGAAYTAGSLLAYELLSGKDGEDDEDDED